MELDKLDIDITLALSPAEAEHGCRKRVSITRVVRCSACAEHWGYRDAPPCGQCDRGLQVRTESVLVHVPLDVVLGTRLRLKGKGHESLRGAPGDLFVLLEAPPAPPPLRSERETPAETKRNRRAIAAVVGGAGLVALLAGAVAQSSGAALGAKCAVGKECRSGTCLDIYRPREIPIFDGLPPIELGAERSHGVCTRACKTTDDCENGLTCQQVDAHGGFAHDRQSFHPDTWACAPP